jgi:hypothetical protein
VSGTFDSSNSVRQAVELAGVNPLGPPQAVEITPSEGYQGESVEVMITGSNFLAGAMVEVSGFGVAVSNVTVEDSNTIKALFTVDISAPVTARDVSIINPHDQSAVISGAFKVLQRALDCSQAFVNQACLWPANHKYVDIEILGMIDPEGDPVDIIITSIMQDEPVDAKGLGDGRTLQDGKGIGTSVASIRAERQGKGNGRVYEISFEATDQSGEQCIGMVTVCVPHDSKAKCQCVDDGTTYDSTVEVEK